MYLLDDYVIFNTMLTVSNFYPRILTLEPSLLVKCDVNTVNQERPTYSWSTISVHCALKLQPHGSYSLLLFAFLIICSLSKGKNTILTS